MTQIIDISTWNGAVDFEKVKAAGIEGVILRAGFGNGTLDNEFVGNINRAIDSGIKYIGAYWFGYAFTVDQARYEATMCDKVLEKYKDWLNLGVFYDWEYDSEDYTKKHGVKPELERPYFGHIFTDEVLNFLNCLTIMVSLLDLI